MPHIGWSIVFTPLLCLLIVLPTVAVSLPIAALAVYYRDFKYALPFLVQIWLFASPGRVPALDHLGAWQPLYAFLNPVVGPLDGFSHVLAAGNSPGLGPRGDQRRVEHDPALGRVPDLQDARARDCGRGVTMWAVRFEEVTKQYRRGGPRYATIGNEFAQFASRIKARMRGREPTLFGPQALDHVSFEVARG